MYTELRDRSRIFSLVREEKREMEEQKPRYEIYWLVGQQHCHLAYVVRQVDGKLAYVCKHEVEEKEKECTS